jgi:hypothetical protein
MTEPLIHAEPPPQAMDDEPPPEETGPASEKGGVVIKEHADQRLKERLGLPKSARQSAAQRAFDKGRHHKDATGRLKRYLDGCWLKHRNANNVRLHAEHIWFFAGHNLITIYEIPKKLRGGI